MVVHFGTPQVYSSRGTWEGTEKGISIEQRRSTIGLFDGLSFRGIHEINYIKYSIMDVSLWAGFPDEVLFAYLSTYFTSLLILLRYRKLYDLSAKVSAYFFRL